MFVNCVIKNVARRGFGWKFKSATIHSYQFRTLPIAVSSIKLEKKTLAARVCQFHVTSPKNALPPVLVILLRYVVKIGAIISGRAIRKWWRKLTPKEQAKIWHLIRSKKNKIYFALGALVCCTYLFYIGHIVEDPITKRRRFMMLNQKQINQIAEFEYTRQMHMFKSYIVPSSHPLYRRVLRVANNLLLANRDFQEIRDKVWSVIVIDRPDITNAFALPHGKIFVFTGMLNICTNDDQLAVVLAHEIAHSILSHVAESMSKIFFVEFILLVPTFFFWLIFPDIWALLSDWITSSFAKVFIHLPFSRYLEREADVVGIQLAAKSCYDVREGPVFWGKMKFVNRDFPAEWLSTHPGYESRQIELQQMLPHAIKIREQLNCPPLKLRLW